MFVLAFLLVKVIVSLCTLAKTLSIIDMQPKSWVLHRDFLESTSERSHAEMLIIKRFNFLPWMKVQVVFFDSSSTTQERDLP